MNNCAKCGYSKKNHPWRAVELDGMTKIDGCKRFKASENTGCTNIVSDFVTCGTVFKDGAALCGSCSHKKDGLKLSKEEIMEREEIMDKELKEKK